MENSQNILTPKAGGRAISPAPLRTWGRGGRAVAIRSDRLARLASQGEQRREMPELGEVPYKVHGVSRFQDQYAVHVLAVQVPEMLVIVSY